MGQCCIHATVVMLAVATEKGNTGDLQLSNADVIVGRDGRRRATAAAQKKVLVATTDHYVKRSTQKKRERRLEGKKKAVEEEKERKKRRREELSTWKVEAQKKNESGQYCSCGTDDDGTPMVMCSYCKLWYHIHCLNRKQYKQKQDSFLSKTSGKQLCTEGGKAFGRSAPCASILKMVCDSLTAKRCSFWIIYIYLQRILLFIILNTEFLQDTQIIGNLSLHHDLELL